MADFQDAGSIPAASRGINCSMVIGDNHEDYYEMSENMKKTIDTRATGKMISDLPASTSARDSDVFEGQDLNSGSYKIAFQDLAKEVSKKVSIPVATSQAVGGIKGSSADKKVNVIADGTATVNNVPSVTEMNAGLSNKVDIVPGKQLSQEDFTTALKQKLEGLSSVMQLKGRVDNVGALPNNSNQNGDVYLVGAAGSPSFEEYIWEGTKWEKIGEVSQQAVSYGSLTNKPQIESHELVAGNNTAASLGLAKADEVVKLTGAQEVGGVKTFRDGIKGTIKGDTQEVILSEVSLQQQKNIKNKAKQDQAGYINYTDWVWTHQQASQAEQVVFGFGIRGDSNQVYFQSLNNVIKFLDASNIRNLAAPTDNTDAANKQYVDTAVAGKLDASALTPISNDEIDALFN